MSQNSRFEITHKEDNAVTSSLKMVLVDKETMGLNLLFFSLPDLVIRIDGIVMIIGIILASYSTVKCMKKNR